MRLVVTMIMGFVLRGRVLLIDVMWLLYDRTPLRVGYWLFVPLYIIVFALRGGRWSS